MSLTEEQRAAIHAVSGLLTAIGCPQCHSYLQKNYTHHIEVLRAMTDRSGTVEPVGGFDLERARGLRDFLQDDCAEVGDVWAEMIAEIERLREALDESERVVAHKTKSAAHWYDEHLQARADRVQTRRVVEQQAARIKELESLVESSMSLVGCHQRVIEKREKALVEERARYIDDFIHEFDPQEDRLDEAREQLRAEGKIGPDADAKPHCWQITEERKAAIDRSMRFLSWANAKTNKPEIDIDLEVLRAMLTEAGQE